MTDRSGRGLQPRGISHAPPPWGSGPEGGISVMLYGCHSVGVFGVHRPLGSWCGHTIPSPQAVHRRASTPRGATSPRVGGPGRSWGGTPLLGKERQCTSRSSQPSGPDPSHPTQARKPGPGGPGWVRVKPRPKARFLAPAQGRLAQGLRRRQCVHSQPVPGGEAGLFCLPLGACPSLVPHSRQKRGSMESHLTGRPTINS